MVIKGNKVSHNKGKTLNDAHIFEKLDSNHILTTHEYALNVYYKLGSM